MKSWMLWPPLMLALNLALAGGMAQGQAEYVNWENAPVRALDLSPDGRLLAVAHTADARVQLFDVTAGLPVYAGSLLTGLDPVAVRFRSNAELWVVNHLSDSVSIIDVPRRQIRLTLATLDEPYDVVFSAGGRAFVTASQVNRIQVFNLSSLGTAPQEIMILGEDPRALAVSPDGSTVYAAIFESGNGTTLVAGGTANGNFPPNAAQDGAGPYAGINPPPNSGTSFEPALNPALGEAPAVGQIVRRTSSGRWVDDNAGDWTDLVSGPQASRSGRFPGWDLPDRDLAVIDAASLSVTYRQRITNMVMAVEVNPATGEALVVGTDATNEVRFEPNLNGRFLRVQSALVSGSGATVRDLNPHLDYATSTVSQSERDRSIGDPRSLVFTPDGSTAYVAGMGSNNVVVLNGDGSRRASAAPIEVGEGPNGIVLSADGARLFVWNHFEASLSTVDLEQGREIQRQDLHNPLPAAIQNGRPFFYDTHATSGLGHASCASCHVDGRTDRLAWDLGDPSGENKSFNQNCMSFAVGLPCSSFHPLKGPMTTQTLQDIIGKEPLHWRGDRDGLEEFNPAFVGLMGDDTSLTEGQMQQFEDFLATITFPPNPFRGSNNLLGTQVSLDGHVTSGRFGAAGRPLGVGNAVRGRDLFLNTLLVDLPGIPGQTTCGSCHTVPTGLGSNGRLFDPIAGNRLGGTDIPDGPNGENHFHVTGAGTLSGGTFKIPQLRNMHEKTGFSLSTAESSAGFGYLHDGAVDTLSEFVSLEEFVPESDQDVADVVAFLLSFSGSAIGTVNAGHEGEIALSQDTHAAIGQQATLTGAVTAQTNTLLDLADAGVVGLVAHRGADQWLYDDGGFESDQGGRTGRAALLGTASGSAPLTLTAVPIQSANRLALDRDRDGVRNGVETAQGSPAWDGNLSVFRPAQGLWYNPARSGHGVDLQIAGGQMAGTWYTYSDDGTPVWYQAVAPFSGQSWTADLLRYELQADGTVAGTSVGSMTFEFTNPDEATFSWVVDGRPGSEPFQRFRFATETPLRQVSGLWFNPGEPGYGISVDALSDVRVVVAYFYDANNQPRWVIGQADNAATTTISMLSVNGFCPDCAFVDTTTRSGGTLTVGFEEVERRGNLVLSVDYPAVSNSLFEREADVIPLTDVPVNLDG
ncbi:MAG: hypothetical protein AAGA23_17425 [Pseudomonadota bacterium]